MNLTSKQKNYIFIAGLTLAIFTVTYTVLLLLGLAPKQFQSEDSQNIFQIIDKEIEIPNEEDEVVDTNLIPQKIEIPKIGVSSVIQLPTAVDVATLDASLAKGAVYYPGSGTLQKEICFLLGHSTNWKIVNNQAYKTFNDLDKLIKGDQIEIKSNDKTYLYRVTKVYRASQDDVLVEFNKRNRMLTISTCDTFGRKQDRWVVEAEFSEVI